MPKSKRAAHQEGMECIQGHRENGLKGRRGKLGVIVVNQVKKKQKAVKLENGDI